MKNYLDKSKLIVSSIILGLILIPSVAYGEIWYNEDWDFSKKITINGSQVNGTHVNFPMVINITDADLQAKAASDGLDIVFTTLDNETKLNHEIEQYNNSIGWLTAWVSIPLLIDATSQDIIMYYGDTGNNGQQNNTAAVWTNYNLVMHMGNDLRDSSGNNVYATNEGTTTINSGGLGLSRSFDGLNDFIDLDDPHLDLNMGGFGQLWGLQANIFLDAAGSGNEMIFSKQLNATANTKGWDFKYLAGVPRYQGG